MNEYLTNPLATFAVSAASFATLGAFVTHIFYRRMARNMRQDWLDIAHYHEQHAERLLKDDVRMGIDEGIGYAAAEMQRTVLELYDHIQPKEKIS